MFRKLFCLLPYVLMLGLLLPNISRAADPDLIGWWKLDEGSGDIAHDSSRSGNNGTIARAASGGLGTNGSVWFTDAVHGTVASFNGNDSSGCVIKTNLIIPAIGLATDFTWTFWAYQDPAQATNNDTILGNRYGGAATPLQFCKFTPTRFEFYNDDGNYLQGINYNSIPGGEWIYHTVVKDGTSLTYYRNAEVKGTNTVTKTMAPNPFYMGGDAQPAEIWQGRLSDVRLYTKALSLAEVLGAMKGSGEAWPYASSPSPANGALHNDTWVTLSWKPGPHAVSHDVYLGDKIEDVNNAAHDSPIFRGNQNLTYYVAGFPGFAYPNGLVPGTTYYWRIDEVNNADPNSPWKGEIWSFSIPPKKAYNPVPADGAESVALDAKLTWTAGFGARLHYVYFGDKYDTVATAAGGPPQGSTTYTPSGLKRAKTYYWRVDEFDGTGTYKGDVWSFTTLGAVGKPNPANGAVDVKQTPVLTWTPGAYAASHEVYFGTDAEAVRKATKTSPEFKATKTLGDESYAPGKLAWTTTYYWRIDEVNSVNPDGPWTGKVWSFTTAGFLVLDDFEDYSAANPIWWTWHDGLGYGVPSTPPYYAGNGTGSAVGDETTTSTCEQTIVHGGKQSMPVTYDNNKQGFAKYSEVERTFTTSSDWTEENIGELSIWFRGRAGSVGSFVEGPVGTYTITASGADIWNKADQFHFAYKTLSGVGSIEAQVLSVDNTDPWAKAGVMIRESLTAGSNFAAVYITPGNGCRFQARMTTDAAATSDSGVATTQQTAIKAPYWIKIERDAGGNFRGYYSANGTTWTNMSWNPQNIMMGSNVYIGLALTAHNANATCTAKFSNVKTTGGVGVQWANQDIGIASNAAEPLYVVISNSGGQPAAVVTHPDPKAAQIIAWTEWVIPLKPLADQGINLAKVDKLTIGMGTRSNMTTPGGSGKMYFDDIRLYRPRTAP